MRIRLALSAVLTAAVVPFGSAATASAVCVHWYYELTGDCSPCEETDEVVDLVLGLAGLDNPTECVH